MVARKSHCRRLITQSAELRLITTFFRSAECLLLAQSGHFATEFQCLLLGVKRTSRGHAPMSAYDPRRTLTASLKPLPAFRPATIAGPEPRGGQCDDANVLLCWAVR